MFWPYLPAKRDGDDPGAVLGDFEEHGHGQVEVRARRIAPPAVVIRECIIGRTKVGGCHENRGVSSVAPLWVIHALDFETSSTAGPVVEQSCAQRCRVHAVPLAV